MTIAVPVKATDSIKCLECQKVSKIEDLRREELGYLVEGFKIVCYYCPCSKYLKVHSRGGDMWTQRPYAQKVAPVRYRLKCHTLQALHFHANNNGEAQKASLNFAREMWVAPQFCTLLRINQEEIVTKLEIPTKEKS